MDTIDIFTRLQKEIDIYLDAYPNGISTPDVAEQLGVTRQTTHRDLDRLESFGIPLIRLDDQKYTIDREFSRAMFLSVTQAWFLYLPLRRMVRSQLHRYPFVKGLLHRISRTLNPTIAGGLIQQIDATNTTGDDLFTILTQAWREQQLVEIQYKPLNEQARRHLIAPYWFEPAVWSDSIYLIAGLVRRDGSISGITFKVDRIINVVPRADSFEIPTVDQILHDIQNTWGIWNAEGVSHVILRFSNRVQERLHETHWHPTQKITEQGDGSVLWEGYIAEPKEMMPWIRGWGADVEVLQPASIRQQIAMDAQLTAQLYGSATDDEGYF